MADLTGNTSSTKANLFEDYCLRLRIVEEGIVTSVGDGIAWIRGLPSAEIDEILELEDGSGAQVFHLTSERVGAILLNQTIELTAGKKAKHSVAGLSIPVGDELIGRVVDPVGLPLDGDLQPQCQEHRPLDIRSPLITERHLVNEPLYTGIKVVDALFPIGKGQRQLLIGDNGLGKSSIAIDTVINQRGRSVFCVYVLIGQKRSTVINTIDTFRKYGAMDYTSVIVAEATSLPGMKYLAPFAGCAVAEYWMREGKDVLIIYDDLTSHAHSYRELSLLLRSPPGREAYPADIFYLHSRLLERATCLNPFFGGGSLTALPIIETKEGEIASYIPTNLISITDGQIYFDSDLFSSGSLPAIDVTKSVSRIGGKAQNSLIKREASRMKLDFLQFLELEAFTRFGAKLEQSTQERLNRGMLLRELMKQERLFPESELFLMAWLVAYNEHCFDGSDIEQLPEKVDWLKEALRSTQLSLSSSLVEWHREVKKLFGKNHVEAG